MYFTYEQPDFDVNDPGEIRRVIEEAYTNGRESTYAGAVADYIPELAKAPRDDFGLCVRSMTGETIAFGETEKRFSIQSISKVISLAAALKFLGFRETFSHVMMEPSGDAFNSILKLDTASDLPFNPMINAGAIQVMSMLSGIMDFDGLLDFARAFCMDEGHCAERSGLSLGNRDRQPKPRHRLAAEKQGRTAGRAGEDAGPVFPNVLAERERKVAG